MRTRANARRVVLRLSRKMSPHAHAGEWSGPGDSTARPVRGDRPRFPAVTIRAAPARHAGRALTGFSAMNCRALAV